MTEIPNQPDVDDQGQAFGDTEELGDYAFLQYLNPKQLGKRVEKSITRLMEPAARAKPAPKIETDDDDMSDEDELSDAINHALDNSQDGEGKWGDEEQCYELEPRKGSSEWRKKESTRLPVRTSNGKLRQAEEPSSSGESESESELEESDSDDEMVVKEVQEGSLPAEVPKGGPEAIIEAKEALAKLAEEIAESPEEKVILSFPGTSNPSGFKSQVIQGNLQ